MPRPPDPTVDLRIREATTSLLLTKGFDFTMDEVAAAAGVGRASVFRRHASKRELLLDTLATFIDAGVAIPDTGSLRGDLQVVVTETIGFWTHMRLIAKQTFAEAGRDPGLGEIIRTAMRKRIDRSWAIFDRAVARGELRADRDPRLLADLLSGLVTYRGLLDLDFPPAEEIVEVLLHGYAPR
ncbi:TetR-like C-terminal domain-containing protein [Nonomuraea sp. NPDC050310]|uniref:TetR-like C-terminal domain-containing protein n=1 Tax=Nonomuraea sp. NPDC050310 TaxID=3154935 RepID=UPI00340C9494